ncbi:TMEM175 family protein [Myxococcus stipitatus]|uniref:TMEM175 family protein n=1 Tax=Myxococcus stipitatus TaxID=83455 RepID=UPI0031454D0E
MSDTERKDSARLEAFSDGVYAVVITLLALELKPELSEAAHDSHTLLWQLASRWPTYVAFVTSFCTVLIMWIDHHGMLKFVRRVDTRVLFANGFLMLLTTLVPFTTAVLSAHLMEPSGAVAGALYAGLFVLINAAYNLLWHLLQRQAQLDDLARPVEVERRLTRHYRLGLPVYLAATIVALWSLPLCLAMCASMWVLWSTNMRPVHDGADSRA